MTIEPDSWHPRDDVGDTGPDAIEDEFDCPRFPTPDGMFCPKQGSEECDWDCPWS